MSAKFKLKNRENWKRQDLDEDLSKSDKNQFSEQLYFYLEEGVLGLGLEGSGVSPVYLDLDQILEDHIHYYHKRSAKIEPFYKALKIQKNETLICDLTGGLLGDSMLMLAWGAKVRCYEGNPILKRLIANALERASHPLLENFEFVSQYFEWKKASPNQTFFYDPYFYKENEKTKVGKKMQLLRLLDQEPAILNKPNDGIGRVIVKRHMKAMDLWPHPKVSYRGKVIRYDVY